MKKKMFTLVFFLLLIQGAFSQISRLEFYDFGTNKIPSATPVVSPWDDVPSDIKNRNSFRRLEWFYRPRMNEQGIFPNDFIDMQKQAEMLKTQNRPELAVSGEQWTSLGPVGVDFTTDSTIKQWGIVSGRVKGLAVHPTDPNIIYAGCGGGGIWKSTNGGQTWVDKSGELHMLTFGSIAIDPSNPEVIYAGTGEYVIGLTERFYWGDGMYKSTNGGDNWEKINAGFGSVTHFTALAVSPHNPNIVMAAIAKNLENAAPNEGIWRSSDAGVHWSCVLPGEGMWDIAFHPTDPNLVWVACGNAQPQAGILKSHDGGITFTQSNTGLPVTNHINRLQFDLCRSNPSVLYTVIYNATPEPGEMGTTIYKSLDGGTSWTQISLGVNLSPAGEQGFYDQCIAVDPQNPNHLLSGNVELVRSTDGATFSFVRDPNAFGGGQQSFDSYNHFDNQIIRFAPSDPSVIYLGCDGGVYRSSDGGTSFTPANTGIASIQSYRVASHISNPDVLYSGAQDNGFISTHNKGATVYKLENFADGTECFMDYSDTNVIFFETFCGFLGRTTNGGQSWELSVDPGPFDSNAFISPYWQHPVEPNIIYGCIRQKLLKSTDKGTTWAYTTSYPIVSTPIYSAVQSPLNPNNIMVAARNGAVSLVKSGDGGISWQDITGSLGMLAGGNFMRLVADPRDGNTFYLLKSTYSGALVLKTTNFGSTWIDLSSDLPKVPVNDLFIDTANAGVMYLANDFGVYRTTNGGGSWARFGDGLPFIPVLDFDCFSHSGTRLLRVATFGRGVFEFDLNKPQCVEEGVPGFAALHAWPNPVSGKLWVDIPPIPPDRCTLSLVSVMGSEVATLPGYTTGVQTRTSMDVSGLQPGCYLLVFKGNRELQTCRVVIVK
jgi:photosystem II stability/assembly factor-like uncharacterized protein